MPASRDGSVTGPGLRALGGLLLLLCTGCPETWGIDGTMDRAMSKDIQQMGRGDKCPLSHDVWERLCEDRDKWVQRNCPPECRQ